MPETIPGATTKATDISLSEAQSEKTKSQSGDINCRMTLKESFCNPLRGDDRQLSVCTHLQEISKLFVATRDVKVKRNRATKK